jgi:hypothetical protein
MNDFETIDVPEVVVNITAGEKDWMYFVLSDIKTNKPLFKARIKQSSIRSFIFDRIGKWWKGA